ncbi:MAG: hypothetical protein HOF21_16005 [Nitrospina sp.]|jgi:hypothetical protein|nr:hypothetical protein [Nitrospina sp.]MBT5632277.1 hypothetical protein [Nitrospina sp.]
MSQKVTLNIESELYQRLEAHFRDDEQGLNHFIIESIRKQLSDLPITQSQSKQDDLENYLKKGSSGSRTYGIKGQGW